MGLRRLFLPVCLQSCLLIMMSGCGVKIGEQGKSFSDFITGSIPPLKGLIQQQSNSSMMGRAYQSSCSTSEVVVNIHPLDQDGKIIFDEIIYSAPVTEDTTYTVPRSALPELSRDKVSYVAKVAGCADKVLMRPLTSEFDINEEESFQDITYSSTLIAASHSAHTTNNLNQVNKKEIEVLISSLDLNAPNEIVVYDKLTNSSDLKSKFQNVFGTSPKALEEAAPKVDLMIPAIFKENEISTLRAIAHHWNPNYDTTYIWKLNGVTKSNQANWSLRPGANDQGDHSVTLFVGHNDGNGGIDSSKPFNLTTFHIKIENNFPALAPTFELDPNSHTQNLLSTRSIRLRFNTGAAFSACESFDSLALVEGNQKPSSSAQFNIVCSDEYHQLIDFQLSPNDGEKILSLWALDSSGKISSQAKKLSLTLDTTAPSVSFNTLPGILAGGKEYHIQWSALDPNGIASTLLAYSLDGVDYTTITSPWTAPTINTSNLTLKLIVTDNAQNTTTITSAALEIDSLAPVVTLISPVANTPFQDEVTLSGTCETGGKNIQIRGDIVSEMSLPCINELYSSTVRLSGADGTKTLNISQEDQAGNATSIAHELNKDTTPPTLTQTLAQRESDQKILTNTSTLTFGGSCENNLPIEVSGIENVTRNCNSGTWSYTTPTVNNDGEYSFTFSSTDSAGNQAGLTEVWQRDATGPVVSQMVLANGTLEVRNNLIPISLTLADPHGVEKVCLKYNMTTTPNTSDNCWLSVTAPPINLAISETVHIENLNYQLGVGAGLYEVYAWGMDTLGNISILSNGGAGTPNSDKSIITYTPGTPPEVRGIILANTDAPSNPLSFEHKTFSLNDDVYIKWNVYDREGLHTHPISLYYTTNDHTYIAIAEDLANEANGSCTPDHLDSTLDDNFTGCYLWENAAPTPNYFKLLLVVKDDENTTNTAYSNEANSSRLQILAGNTSPGLGGPASTAIFYHASGGTRADSDSLVVADNGDIYIRDTQRGIIRISQETGTADVFIALDHNVNTNSWGDDTSVANAKVKRPYKMTYTYDNQLMIMDWGYIRRVDLNTNPATIYNFIGGGSSNADGGSPNDELIANNETSPSEKKNTPFFALPNGDFIFQSHNFPQGSTHYKFEDLRIRRYVHSEKKIYDIVLDGQGPSVIDPQHITSQCSYNSIALAFNPADSSITHGVSVVRGHPNIEGCTTPTNSTIGFMAIDSDLRFQTTPTVSNTIGHGSFNSFTNGLDGHIYRVVREEGRIQRYNPTTGRFDFVVGTGQVGECEDTTPALQCAIAPVDIFVTAQGRIYIYEGRRIRFIDQDEKIVTLAGTSYSHGDNGPPLLARFGSLGYIDKTDDGEYVLLDNEAFRFRSFSLSGTIQTIAGNGLNITNPNPTLLATEQGFYVRSHDTISGFGLNKTTGDIYYSYGRNKIARLDRGDQKWVDLVGGGSFAWQLDSANNKKGNEISLSNVRAMGIFGLHEDFIIGGTYQWESGGAGFSLIKRWSVEDGTQEPFLGKPGSMTDAQGNFDLCPSGSELDACYLHKVQQANGSAYTKFNYDEHDKVYIFGRQSTRNVYQIDLNNNIYTSLPQLPRNIFSLTYIRNEDKSINMYYYCATNGKLYSYDINNSDEKALEWPINSIACRGESLLYDEERHSLVFAFLQNQLYGIAEYFLD